MLRPAGRTLPVQTLSLASALGANDGKAITDAPDTASIAKAASALIIVDLLMLVNQSPRLNTRSRQSLPRHDFYLQRVVSA